MSQQRSWFECHFYDTDKCIIFLLSKCLCKHNLLVFMITRSPLLLCRLVYCLECIYYSMENLFNCHKQQYIFTFPQQWCMTYSPVFCGKLTMIQETGVLRWWFSIGMKAGDCDCKHESLYEEKCTFYSIEIFLDFFVYVFVCYVYRLYFELSGSLIQCRIWLRIQSVCSLIRVYTPGHPVAKKNLMVLFFFASFCFSAKFNAYPVFHKVSDQTTLYRLNSRMDYGDSMCLRQLVVHLKYMETPFIRRSISTQSHYILYE